MANVIHTQDRVELTHEEIQKLLRDHIEKTTGRRVDRKNSGEVNLRSQADAGISGKGTTWTAWAHLLDERNS